MKSPSTDHMFDRYDQQMVNEIIRGLLPAGLNKETVDREKHLVHSFIDDLVSVPLLTVDSNSLAPGQLVMEGK